MSDRKIREEQIRRVLRHKGVSLQALVMETGALHRLPDLLRITGAPTSLSDIHIPDALADTLWTYAPYVRRRLTFMRAAGLLRH